MLFNINERLRKLFRRLAGYSTVPRCAKCGRFMKKTIVMGGDHYWSCRNPKCNLKNQGRLFD